MTTLTCQQLDELRAVVHRARTRYNRAAHERSKRLRSVQQCAILDGLLPDLEQILGGAS